MDLIFLKLLEEVKSTNKIVKVSLVVALIFAIASIGFANAAPRPLQIVRMCHATSTEDYNPTLKWKEQFSWTGLPGNQFPVAHLKLDGNSETWYYLDVTFVKPQVPLNEEAIASGVGDLFPFFLDPNTYTENSEFKAYWDAKLDAAAGQPWVPIMTSIIHGTAPMFTLAVGTEGTYRLYDGLQGILFALTMGPPPGPVRLNGDYPRGRYVFTAVTSQHESDYLEGVTISIKIG
jgi:hypothetical protein